MLTLELLKEYLHYDPITGTFTWRVRRGSRAAGHRAGCVDPDGYVCIRIEGVLYAAPRLAWLYMTGAWPEFNMDHRDGVPGNNRFSNLRDVTQAVNLQNMRKAMVTNRHGFLGVTPCGGRGWVARIRVEGRQRHIGVFDTPEDAHAAYVEAKRKFHPGCTI